MKNFDEPDPNETERPELEPGDVTSIGERLNEQVGSLVGGFALADQAQKTLEGIPSTAAIAEELRQSLGDRTALAKASEAARSTFVGDLSALAEATKFTRNLAIPSISEETRKALAGASTAADTASIATQARDALRATSVFTEAERQRLESTLAGVRAAAIPKIDYDALLSSPRERRLELDLPTPRIPATREDIAKVSAAVNAQTEAVNAQTDAVHAQTAAIVALHRAIEVVADRGDSRTRWIIRLSAVLVVLTWVIAGLTALLVWMA